MDVLAELERVTPASPDSKAGEEAAGTEYRLRVDVVDTGIGIASDKLEYIFEPFSQADTSITRSYGGTGLGLAISRRVAVALGGTLTARSRENEGSTFTARVSAGQVVWENDQDPLAAGQNREEHQTKMHNSDQPRKVLIVDEGETNLKLVCLLLDTF